MTYTPAPKFRTETVWDETVTTVTVNGKVQSRTVVHTPREVKIPLCSLKGCMHEVPAEGMQCTSHGY